MMDNERNIKAKLEGLAIAAFELWVSDLTEGEIYDMLVGNQKAYSEMPNLHRYVNQDDVPEPTQFR